MISTDTKLDLVINSMSEDTLKTLEAAGSLPPNQLWGTPDVSTEGDVQNTLNELISKTTDHDAVLTALQTALDNHNHDDVYSKLDHTHDSDYSKLDHTHQYSAVYTGTSATQSSNNTLSTLRIGFVSNNLYIWNS